METGHGPLSAVNEPPSGDDFHPEMVPKSELVCVRKTRCRHVMVRGRYRQSDL